MRELQANESMVNSKLMRMGISSFICDAPGHAFVKVVKGHNVYHGGDKCTQREKWLNNRMSLQCNVPLRIDVLFDEMVDEDHHGQSILKELKDTCG